jgi:hypothetical protein
MPDYSKGKIYALRSHQTDDIYIGSTIQALSVRIGEHKRTYKKYINGNSNSLTSFELIKYDDCYIELIEDYPCENKNQLEKREGELIRSMECVNKRIEGRTYKEYREDNKEQLAEKNKKWREKNKDEIREKRKRYREENKDTIRDKLKKWRKENIEKIKEKTTCNCGGKYTKNNLSRHKKSKKHQEYLAKNLETN